MIKIGVLCPSEIAYRRFMPALKKCDNFVFAGVAVADSGEWNGTMSDEIGQLELNKASRFPDEYGGIIFDSYTELIKSHDVDAVYIPLPPALHYKWGKIALENGKHVFMEKPFTTSAEDTKELIVLAKEKGLALHENYMFVYHSQLEWIMGKIYEGVIGDIRLIRIDFGFPFRGAEDFRYDRALGGGALLDCGGYTLKLASLLLGETAEITASKLNYKDEFDVDIYGSASLTNSEGVSAQVSFGMDNSYRCSLDIWGSTGSIYTNRILTAPDGFEPVVIIKSGNEEQSYTLPADDTFGKSIGFFEKCLNDSACRNTHYSEIIKQSELVEKIKERG